MRYLGLTVVVAGVAAAFAFGCGDGDSISATPAGNGGSSGEAGSLGGGTGGKVGTAGKGGTAGTAGTAGNGGAAGRAGTGGTGGDTGGGNGGTGAGGGAAGAGEAGQTGVAGSGEGGAAGQTSGIETGSLAIAIDGLPAGVAADTTVTGPNAFSQAVSSAKTLNGLPPGSYAVAAASVRATGTLVDSVFDPTVTGNPATVAVDATATATVTYAQRSGSGMLWVTNAANRVTSGFSATQIATAGTLADAATVTATLPVAGTGGGAPVSLAFSPDGDEYVGYCRGGDSVPQAIVKLSAAKLAATGSPTPDAVITLPSPDGTYDCAAALAFDPSGNLWVGMFRGHVLRFTPSQLAATGTPTPDVTLTSTSFDGIVDLAFSPDGTMFVADVNKPLISRLPPSQLNASDANITPKALITLPAGTALGGLTFGPGGNLWASDYSHSSVLSLAAADIVATGKPTPKVTLTGITGPEQITFDNAGNLWVASYDANKIFAYAAADLTTTHAITPMTTLTNNGALNQPYAIRFNP